MTDVRAIARRIPVVVPVIGIVLLVVAWGRTPGDAVAAVIGIVLVGVVGVAVVHAEQIAHRVGEPFGTLVLAVAVTIIEVALIVTLMVTESDGAPTLARDTVFAAIMIVCNGVVGVALLAGARRDHVVKYNHQGAQALLGTVLTLATLSLVLPSFTSSSSGPTFNGAQLAFAAVASAVVYGLFVFAQTGRLRPLFLDLDSASNVPATSTSGETRSEDVDDHEPSDHDNAEAGDLLGRHVVLLVVSLVAVVGLAKSLSKPIERGVAWLGAPDSFVGVVIALIVLLPESVAAVRAAADGRTQSSLNLALGSALASIGLTIPAIAIASIWLDGPVALGLAGKEIALLVLTAVISTLTFGSGRTTVLQAMHHIVVFMAFVFLAIEP